MYTSGKLLSTKNHDCLAGDLTYVYPVISRRVGGLSIGINLNRNSACNWRCIYCQVPGLRRGTAPVVDLARMRAELSAFLRTVIDGTFFEGLHIPAEYRQIRAVTLAGNGEPTSARDFYQIVDAIAGEITAANLDSNVRLILITNGSLMQRSGVRSGLVRLSQCNGEVWFKLDAGTATELKRINGTNISPHRVFRNLELTVSRCATWIQTCMFLLDGQPASDTSAYLCFLKQVVEASLPVEGVLLYGPARASRHPEGRRVGSLSGGQMNVLGEQIRALGMHARVIP